MRGSLTTVQQSHCGWWTFEFYQKVCIEGRLPGTAGLGYRFQKHTLSLSRWVWCFSLAGNSSFLGLLSKISVLTKRRLTVPIITHQHLFTVVLVYPIASVKWRITNNIGFFLFAHLVFSSDNCKWITLHVLQNLFSGRHSHGCEYGIVIEHHILLSDKTFWIECLLSTCWVLGAGEHWKCNSDRILWRKIHPFDLLNAQSGVSWGGQSSKWPFLSLNFFSFSP